jgi:uncharacterized protein
MMAVNLTRGKALAEAVEIASNPLKRGVGLLGRNALPEGHGLLLRPCQSIHTFFMRFPIDVIFVSCDDRIIHLVERMGPNRVSRILPKARYALELPAGAIGASMTEVGDKVTLTSQ